MNKAFVKDMDDERASNPLPDRTIPSGPNLVTPAGLIALEQRLAIIEREHADAIATDDVNEIARTERDIRYWTARRATAQVSEASGSGNTVEFGSTVTIRRDDGRMQTLQIVGVDQADPAQGTLSYISPLAHLITPVSPLSCRKRLPMTCEQRDRGGGRWRATGCNSRRA